VQQFFELEASCRLVADARSVDIDINIDINTCQPDVTG
jgi:hypothetical protein